MPDESDAYMYALDLPQERIGYLRDLGISPNADFIAYLIGSGTLVESGTDWREAADGSIVVYFRQATPCHAGRIAKGTLRSKGNGEKTGGNVKVFEPISQDIAVEAYRLWAKILW